MLGMRERFRTRAGARRVWISMIPSVLFEDRWLRFDSAAGRPTLVVWVWLAAAAKSNSEGSDVGASEPSTVRGVGAVGS